MQGTRLTTVTAAAARHQVRTGLTVAQGRAKCAALELLAWDDAIIGREIARATAALLTASPQVSPVAGAPGLWWIGATGFDGIGGEGMLAAALRDIARVWHPQARVAIADSCVAARAATWGRAADADTAPVIVPPGRDAEFLARVPLALIPMDETMREALRALGVTTGGALAALSATDVERRWGEHGLMAWRLAQGDDTRRPALLRGDPRRSASAELGMSVQTTDPLLFLVRGALERLVHDTVRDGRAIAAVAITLTLDDGRPHTVTREARAARPLARVAPLFERCRALLEEWPLTAPVSAVEVQITATAPLPAEQGDLLRPTWRDPSAAEAALERLRAAGIGVVRAAAVDRWGVDRGGVWAAAESGGTRGTSGTGSTGSRTLPAVHRLLSRAEVVPIVLYEGRPVAITWREERIRLLSAVGPERIAGEWWTGTDAARDYWRCVEAGSPHRELLLVRQGSVVGWRD
jgi:protein ImuB